MNNVRVKPSSPRLNRVLKNLELIQPLKPRPGPLEFPFAQLEESQRISDFLTSLGSGRPIAIHPGTSLRQAHKRWPEERFAQVIQGLSAQGLIPILTWGPGELPMVERILSRSGGKGLLAPSTTLAEMRQLLMHCHLFIGGDTGPMHLAWTHGVPVLALFGSTDPEVNGPLGAQHRVLAPAWEAGRPSPRRGDPSPLREILPDRVLREALELLQSAAAPSSRAPAC